MTEQELNALVASLASLEGVASSAPWTYSEELQIINGPFGVPIAIGIASKYDGHLIATARNALVALLGALQAARMERAEALTHNARLTATVTRVQAVIDECDDLDDGSAYNLWTDVQAALAGGR